MCVFLCVVFLHFLPLRLLGLCLRKLSPDAGWPATQKYLRTGAAAPMQRTALSNYPPSCEGYLSSESGDSWHGNILQAW